MSRGPSKRTPTVISGVLYTDDPATSGIPVGSPAWLAWLATAQAFYFQPGNGPGFGARAQSHRRGRFWYAYRRVGGALHKRYLGPAASLTLTRLEHIAAALP